ncbi:hypothetical protein NM208_g3157 [Fusarium decemcellulare]|uniref:Uncharacterized protein n=1 Tax=Fusarium decemcellulare TaxID=57161 RepID=A0ACC1SQ09_9HYPO|nr:hypothetical protein NM208_g3157 [Fusarium decemcellulare]
MNPIKLHEPKPGKKGVYVALSHCWGAKDSRPMQTTVDNLNEMKSNIKWEDLSPVFQDSIWLCRRLGVEFLWIDSLCIIQGDEQDWERESSMMAQYYSHARFTIAVESSPNGKVSFLKERQLRWQAQIYPVTDRSGVERRYSVQEHYHLIGLLPDEINRYFKEGKKLLPSRAWAFQERLLSRRLIRFTPSDIIWQCNGETTFEHDFLNRVLSFQSVFRDRYYSNPTARQTTNSEEQQLNNTWAEWSSNLHEYSRRDLTFERDKLPALSGMATSLENKLKGPYLAGIWADHLPYALCWKRQIGQVTSRLMPENTVPSWSWASLSATAVDYYGDRLDDWQLLPEPQRPQILETQTCKISDQAPFGRVNGGSILMEAPLFEASISLERNGTERPFEVRFRNPDQLFCNLTFWEDCILDTKGGHAVRAIGSGHKERVSGPPESFVKSKAWVVWLAINHEQRWGLVLGKNPQSPDFHRLGILILDTNPKCFRGRPSIRFQLV